MRFLAPVKPGDTVHATVTVTEVLTERRQIKLETICRVRNVDVVEGEATVKVGSLRKREAKAKIAALAEA